MIVNAGADKNTSEALGRGSGVGENEKIGTTGSGQLTKLPLFETETLVWICQTAGSWMCNSRQRKHGPSRVTTRKQ